MGYFYLQVAWLGYTESPGGVEAEHFFTASAVLVRDIAILSPRVHFLSSQDLSILAHAWSKLVFVTFHPLSKAKETFYNSNLKVL